MKIYLGKGNSIITFHNKYIKDFTLYGKEFNHLAVHKIVEEIGTKYKDEKKLSGNTNRNRGLKKIIKHCKEHKKIIITSTEIKALFYSFKKDDEKILKCPWLLDTILICIIELARTLDKETLNVLIKENSISCVNILIPNHKRIINANLMLIEKKETEFSNELIEHKLKKKLVTLNTSLENNFDLKCKLI